MRNLSIVMLVITGLLLYTGVVSSVNIDDPDIQTAFGVTVLEFKDNSPGTVGRQSRFGVTLNLKQARQAVHYALKNVCFAMNVATKAKNPAIFYIAALEKFTTPALTPIKGVIAKCALVVEKSWTIKVHPEAPKQVEVGKAALEAVKAYGVLQCLQYIVALFKFRTTTKIDQLRAARGLLAPFAQTRKRNSDNTNQNGVVNLANRMKEMLDKFHFLLYMEEHRWLYIDVLLLNDTKTKTGDMKGANEDRVLTQESFRKKRNMDKNMYFQTNPTLIKWWHHKDIAGLKGIDKLTAPKIEADVVLYDKEDPEGWDVAKEDGEDVYNSGGD